jgi:glyoxylase-like metal-dependent hydrolase (beta-lactamase superfamily II)
MHPIQVFSSVEQAFLVNSFIIETDSGLVLVDTQFLTSSARALVLAIRERGKPLLGVVITHPHPDHFNGASEIQQHWPGVPIYATQSTIDIIRTTEARKRLAWTPVYGDDYPPHTALPTHPVSAGEVIVIDGLELVLDDLGAGESEDITVVYLPQTRALIVSDLVYHRVHPWLAEGRTRQWLQQIAAVHSRYASAHAVYAGHGQPGTMELLSEQADYLMVFRELVRSTIKVLASPSAEEKSRIAVGIRQRYAGYPLEMLIEMNVEGVAQELAAELATA